MKLLSISLAILLLVLPAERLQAEIVTDSSQIPDPYIVNFDGTPAINGSGIGPLQISNDYGINITVTGSPGPDGIYTRGAWSFGSNGQWEPGNFIGMSSTPPESITVTFKDGPVAAAGVFTNYVPELGEFSTIAVLDENMQVMEEYNLEEVAPIRVSGIGKPGAFRGISRQSNDIYHFRITGEDPVLDDLTFFQFTTPVNVVGSFSLSEFTDTGDYPVIPDPFEASFNVVIDINEVTLANGGTFRLRTVLDTIEPSPLTVGTETFTADQIVIQVQREPTEGGPESQWIGVVLGIGDGSLTARTNDFSTSYGVLIDASESTLPRTVDITPITDNFSPHKMVNEPIGGGIQSATVAAGSVSLSVRGEVIYFDGFEGLQ